MNSLKAFQPSFAPPTPPLARRRKAAKPCSRRPRSAWCFCRSNDAGPSAGSSSPPQGDKRTQELLSQIALLQVQKVRVAEFIDERSAYLTKFAEDANAEFDQIGATALRELEEASAMIMEKLDSRMQAFEEAQELTRQEIERNERVLEEFEEQMERDRNEGLFFKSLRRKKSPAANKERAAAAAAEAKMEARKLKEATRRNTGSKIRSNMYLALIAVLGIAVGNAMVATPEVEWRKVASMSLIFVGLVAQFVYEKSLSSETEDESLKK